MTDTFTTKQRIKLENYLRAHELSSGIGTKESACSIAAINLAISGKLTDDIPECMSKVLGKATIRLQDEMPYEMRNSERYKRLLPDMAGTGQEHEQERAVILLDWMWSVVLPQVQPVADGKGFGKEWAQMCKARTSDAADAAYAAARAAAVYAASAAYAVRAANAAADYVDAAYAASVADAAYTTADAARAAYADAAAYAVRAAYADAAADAAAAAAAAARAAARADFWNAVDPIGLLERMTYLKG